MEKFRNEAGSILYFATHGNPGLLSLSDRHDVCLEQLAMYLKKKCAGRMVHFSGCELMKIERHRIQHFMEETSCVVVSGYTEEVGWIADDTPALLLELEMFARISPSYLLNMKRNHGRFANLRNEFHQTRKECGFQLYTRQDLLEWE